MIARRIAAVTNDCTELFCNSRVYELGGKSIFVCREI